MSQRSPGGPAVAEPPGAPRPPRREFGVAASDRRGGGGNGLLLGKLLVAALSLLVGFLGVLTAYAAATLPSLDGIAGQPGTIRFLDRNGRLLAEIGTGDGQPHAQVSLDQVAPVMQQAIVAVEDRNFWNEGAFNPGRVARALVIDVVAGQPEQGASTITQQLAKRAFLLDDSSAVRKLREALLANEIDQRYSKRAILQMYLNVVYFGHGATGIEDAAVTYFGRHASQLDLAEASLLAGLGQAPSEYDPFENPQLAFARQHVVLQAMVTAGDITQSAADSVDPDTANAAAAQQAARRWNQEQLLADLRNGHAPPRAPVLAPHFVEYARNQLAALLSDQSSDYQGSLTVVTTLDLGAQSRAEAAVAHGVASLAGRRVDNAAMLMLDAHTGDILAMVGSAGYDDAAISGEFNVVTAQRQPGSAFKPVVYGAAFQDGALTPSTLLDDTEQESRRLGGVQDFDRSFLGRIPASQALLLSRNVPAEEAMLREGVTQTIGVAHDLGITSPLAANASTAIGSSSVRMLDLAQAYTAFAQDGTTATPRAILRVLDSSGATLYDGGQFGDHTSAMSSLAAEQVTAILRGYPRQWGLDFRHATAGKSGTTDGFVDAWYVAYTPDWVVATWAGHTSAQPVEEGLDQVYGIDVGKAITVPFVNALSGPFTDFPPCYNC